ncbi:MAG: hypothetical protein AMXMBFR61_17540 [Fimbriimonadales bacterium]
MGGMNDLGAGHLSNTGHYFVRTVGTPSQVMLNSQFLPDTINGVTDLWPAGVDDDGNWLAAGKLVEYPHTWRVLHNGVIQNEGWHSGVWQSIMAHLNPQGKMRWTNGSNVRATVMKQGVDYSDQWTDGWYDRSWDVTPEGRILWWGRGYG